MLASATNDACGTGRFAWLLNVREEDDDGDPDVALDLYTRQSALAVTARDLAVMGATTCSTRANPLIKEQVLPAELCHHVLAVMVVAGLYESSGDWFYRGRLFAKSGIGAVTATGSRQGRPRHVLSTAGRRRQQRPRAARGTPPVRRAGAGPAGVRPGAVTRGLAWRARSPA